MKRFGLALFALLLGLAPAQPQNAGWPPPAGAQAMLCVYNSTPPTLTNGQVGFVNCDAAGNLVTGGGGGGLSVTDGAAWTEDTSAFTPGGCTYTDAAALAAGTQGTFRCTTKRALVVDVDSTGNALYTVLDNINTNIQGSIPAGTALIGDVNLRQGGSALSATNGAFANILQGNAVLSATNPSFAQPVAGTAGGATSHHAVLAATTNATVVKASAGQLYTIQTGGISASAPAFLKFYDKATSPTCNSDTVVLTIVIPANSLGGGNNSTYAVGRAFTSGIAYCVTAGIADNDNTAVAASTWTVNMGYK